MAILIQEALDSDIPHACAIETRAYANSPLNPILFPGPFDPNPPDGGRPARLIRERKEDPTTRYVKAVDNESGEMMAFAGWHIYATPEDAQIFSERKAPEIVQGMNAEACLIFFEELTRKKREVMGEKRHCYLHLLYTDPRFQRRGAAAMLVKWGTDVADELGIPTYLESSMAGHPLYLKCGFKDVDEVRISLRPWGNDSDHVNPLMIREPANST